MAVKIRMKRMGAKKNPFYRIVVADVRAPRDGKFIEEIGYYNPMVEPKVFKVDNEKLEKWLSNGAKPTETVAKLLKNNDVAETEVYRKSVKSLETKMKKEEAKAAQAKAQEEAKAAKEARKAENAEKRAKAQAELKAKREAEKGAEEVAQEAPAEEAAAE